MGAEYQLRIIDTAGATQAVITDFLQLAYTRVVNEPGLMSFRLRDNHPALAYIVHNNQVEIYRRNADIGLVWTLDFVGIIRLLTWETTDSTTLTVSAPGIMSVLGWQVVAYKAEALNRSRFVARRADSVMKDIVRFNCTSSGTTTDGRLRAATSSGKVSGLYTISIETDAAVGTTASLACSFDNVLEAVQKLQPASGGDFDLVKTAATTFQFRYYLGQRGTDRKTSLYFALERGNMSIPSFVDDRVDERTVVIVGGKGEASLRTTVTRTGADYSVSSRAFETFLDATNAETTAALNTAGDAAMYIQRADPQFMFTAIQAPNAYYGVHYDLGDVVSATYRGVTYSEKVVRVSVQFDDAAGEQIAVEMEQA